MVAEAVPSTEVEQPESEAVPNLETAPESEPENTEESELESLVTQFIDTDAEAVDGKPASEDGKPAASDPYEGLTPQQIAEKVRAEEAARQRQTVDSAERRRYLEGLARVVQNKDDAFDQVVDEFGIPTDAKKKLKDQFNALNGAYKELYDYDTRAAQTLGVQSVTRGIHEGVTAALGEDAANALMQANHQTWDAYLKDYAETYAKKNGLATKQEVKEARTEAQKTILKKIDTALKERGMSLASITGDASPDLPPIGGRGGGGSGPGPRNLASYNAATMEQRAAWDKADPGLLERLVQEAQRRG